MSLSFSKSFLQNLTVMAVAVVLLLTITGGIHSGQNKAQSEASVLSAASLQKALGNFYADQDRFPTVQEFAQGDIMKNYLLPFPFDLLVSSQCPQNFIYKRPDTQSYQLSFCLNANSGNFIAGWNTIKQSAER